MTAILARGLLVALGCPGEGQCSMFWPSDKVWIRNYIPRQYDEHIEKHTLERLGQEETA